jgi:cell division protease FtsH
MSSLGPVALGPDRGNAFLKQVGGVEANSYSETTARMIDDEVRRYVQEALERARTTLRDNREKVEALAARLLSAEVVEEEELKVILGPKVTRPGGLLHPKAEEVSDPAPAPSSDWNASH